MEHDDKGYNDQVLFHGSSFAVSMTVWPVIALSNLDVFTNMPSLCQLDHQGKASHSANA